MIIPASYKHKPVREKEDLLMNIRVALRKMGEADESIFVFSFYPDVLTLKEVGDPLQVAEFFGLDKDDAESKDHIRSGTGRTPIMRFICMRAIRFSFRDTVP